MLGEFIISLRDDFTNLLNGKRGINPYVFLTPEKYAVCLPISKLVADTKVTRQGIEVYKRRILLKKRISPIIVVRHPKRELYAVLDGHHRYYAYLELGSKEVECALAGDYSSVIFYLAEHGYLQPSPQMTQDIRHPVVRLHENLKQFLNNFLNSEEQQGC